jgi:outer membrane lipoprotein-sorting protein
MRMLLLVLGLIFLVGCATFEQTPQDIEKKLSEPMKGHLYERNPLEGN